ncbi:MAG: phenylalanine--tRNA ligase subunit beta [Campylobacterales bacterium]|nr:phenylalanine--tRNA ligase subunit beta [Campylobacterales bacterium]
MIITKSWLSEFLSIEDIGVDNLCLAFNKIGLEVDRNIKIKAPDGVVIGKILECDKHPNADKLSVCKVDIGSEILQIVCGAKNVSINQYVAIATIGTLLPNGLEIKPVKLRDVDSSGMICSLEELGFNKIEDGIAVLDNSIGNLIVGKSLNDYNLFNDDLIEIELTANRGDCLSIYGIARELSSYFNIQLKPLVSYEEDENNLGIGRVLTVSHVGDIDSSLIYKIINFKNYNIPFVMKFRISQIGFEKISQAQTLINYVTHSTGVIIRGYKFDEIQNNSKVLLKISKNESGVDSIYYKDELISMIGLNQLKNYKCSDLNNSLIVFEMSYINPEFVSKKRFDYKIESDEIFYRTSRGSEPELKIGLDFLCNSLKSIEGVEIYGGTCELSREMESSTALGVSLSKINKIIGFEIEKLRVVSILQSLQFKVTIHSDDDSLIIGVPKYRHDLKNIQDIVEEIYRIYGVDNIKSSPIELIEKNKIDSSYLEYKKLKNIRYKAIGIGFYETITYLFSSKELLKKYQCDTIDDKLDLINPITHELNTLRSTLILNLIEAVSKNIKLNKKSVKFFEIGSVYNSCREEMKKIAFIYSGFEEDVSIINNGKPESISFYDFADKIQSVIGKFELREKHDMENSFIHPYQSADIIVNGKHIGYISKLNIFVQNDFELPQTFIAEISLDNIHDDIKITKNFSIYQANDRDLSFLIDSSMNYLQIKNEIESLIDNGLVDNIKEFYPIDIFKIDNLKNQISITIRFVLQSNSKTLDDEEINSNLNIIVKKLEEKFSIGLR